MLIGFPPVPDPSVDPYVTMTGNLHYKIGKAYSRCNTINVNLWTTCAHNMQTYS